MLNTLLEITALNSNLMTFLAVDIAIAIVLLSAMRFVSGVTAKVNTTDELAKQDNFAFGISVAGSIAALGIVLTGAITGEAAESLTMEVIGMTSYGIFGLVLIKVGRLIHDKFALNQIDKTEQIKAANITVGIVDAAGAIATAIIIKAVLIWVYGLDVNTFIAIFSGFVVSQAVLIIATRIKERQYAKNNQGDSMQQAFANGQVALAIRYAGQVISTALAVTAASYFFSYSPETLVVNLAGWLVFGILMTLLVTLLTFIAKKLILWGINLVEEVDQQHNIGVAAIEMAISISIAMILTGLMA
ncbi:DUF350 domain-containing protein [Thalassotalea euphylliae]|uniref:DUF350 domain-containing protein n=1 Tax=Thalassotalea euphylliae TaxID=1655234 RepID=A0A3E0U659_9GAMM|nr:DUF350 domain-containing protein [Thalassotalea euphylliae]REL32043.1 DUF350 domain-containing protein [Thalassotalea euphylliae]REL36474.1 DUF350 domain-containing protein [Thalassotalea euphylliae]